jgi:hypothetical protein
VRKTLAGRGLQHACSCTCAGGDLGGSAEERQQALLRRLAAFAEDALAVHAADAPHLQALLRKLQDALAACEQFPVQYSQIGPSPVSMRAFGSAAAGARRSSLHLCIFLTSNLKQVHASRLLRGCGLSCK